MIRARKRRRSFDRIAADFPGQRRARRRAPIASSTGAYDLLGYRGLCSFGQPDARLASRSGCGPARAERFWADVPYLDPVCGDHKVIWELNRHQHWLALGRAFWLTGDRAVSRPLSSTELASWLDANPPLIGVNWASMLELGFRSLSWLWAIQFFADAATADDDDRRGWSICSSRSIGS